METKGVDYYAYIGDETFDVVFNQASNQMGKFTCNSTEIQSGNMQVGSDMVPSHPDGDIGILAEAERALAHDFNWTASQNGKVIYSRYLGISPESGNLLDGNMMDMFQTPSQVEDGYALSYGFYDAGDGATGLSNQDQAYVYLTPSQQQWMAQAVHNKPGLGAAPFGVFVLPGAHDAGMYASPVLDELMTDGKFLGAVSALDDPLAAAIVRLAEDEIHQFILNNAFTQKDDFTTMLNLGVRHFDFRPGYCLIGLSLKRELYHQHNFIPGASYSDFLDQVLTWLKANPGEIVAITLRFNGFALESMKPTPEVLEACWQDALDAAGVDNIVAGSHTDLGSSYNELINASKRVIFLNAIDSEPTTKSGAGFKETYNAKWFDSYTDSAYKTKNVNTTIAWWDKLLHEGVKNKQAGVDFTIMEMQGTASTFADSISISKTASPLMATKAMFDQRTYEKIQSIISSFEAEQLMVLLNDFCDNALAQICSGLTQKRLDLSP